MAYNRNAEEKKERRALSIASLHNSERHCFVRYSESHINGLTVRVWAVWPAVAVAFTCAHPICTDRMRTGKRNRHRRPDSPDPNPKSKRDDISINQLT
ncbi:hypothetical protein EVAR_77714_1 [Eumeta japonica]|uniref:Uncharacterized protein n=1 Tax=Eumeta variegata TaxID=151549 RepID=A0A4C1TAN9_EUMVA|nr:hypothetical protein EVAR_77714_1 [Eumeta japonica]